MSENSGRFEAIKVDQELSPAQQALKLLADEMLALRPVDSTENFLEVEVGISPEKILDQLQDKIIGEMMLKDGDIFTFKDDEGETPDFEVRIGSDENQISGVSLWAWGRPYDKVRYDEEDTMIPFPGEQDFTYELDIKLWYQNPAYAAVYQALSISTSTSQLGKVPALHRDIIAPGYTELATLEPSVSNMVYDFRARDEDVVELLRYTHKLFIARLP